MTNRTRAGNLCFIAGAVALLLALALAVAALQELPRGPDWPRSQPITCVNNLKQIGLAFRTWAIDHDGLFPFNLTTNNGGTMELCARGSRGTDRNAALHFQVMADELSNTAILVCPKDRARKPAQSFSGLGLENVTYLLHSGTNISDAHPEQVLAQCPLDGNILHCDGTVTTPGGASPEPTRGSMIDLLKFNLRFRHRTTEATAAALLGCLLLLVGSQLRTHKPSP